MTENARTVWNALTKDKTGWALLILVTLYFGWRDSNQTTQYNETIRLLREQLTEEKTERQRWADRAEQLVEKQDSRGDRVIKVMTDCTEVIRKKDSIINSRR